jgi:hypothetical protein
LPQSLAAREETSVAWFRRRKQSVAAGGRPGRPGNKDDLLHLEQFAKSRRGVEGFVEPRTTVTDTTIILIAFDGEWTRRRIGSPDEARSFGRRIGIPVYDVALVGYPNRMREYNARQKAAEQQ